MSRNRLLAFGQFAPWVREGEGARVAGGSVQHMYANEVQSDCLRSNLSPYNILVLPNLSGSRDRMQCWKEC